MPTRKPTRIPGYDYSTQNYYFVTLCCDKMNCLFGSVDKLNEFGKIAEKYLQSIEDIFPGVTVDKYVVMPNHVHAIIVLNGQGADLTTVIGQYKSAVSKKIHQKDPSACVWQRSFHDHIIRNQQSYEKIWSYIDTNRYRWKDDKFYVE